MKVLLCSPEVWPFAKTGGLADVSGALPIALEKLGIEVTVFMPRYKGVEKANHEITRLDNGLLKAVIGNNINVYFVEHDEYFMRDGLYGDKKGEYRDNLARYKFFCIKILNSLKAIDFRPDVIHCNDWQTALVPVYIKEKYNNDDFYAGIKTVLTIHNLAYQGVFNDHEYGKLELRNRLMSHLEFEFYGQVNLLKAGIIYCDVLTTVSKKYAKEIKTRAYGEGLDQVISARQDDVIGIVNGVDFKIWDPSTDHFISYKYSYDNYKDLKEKNKISLQEKLGLSKRKDVPVFGFVGRLSGQKGIDLIMYALDKVMGLDINIVIQGVGEGRYHKHIGDAERRYPDKLVFRGEFSEGIAHQIYAGSDFFLMPSIFEPCGLSQMISFRYGTIPVAFDTGGLADTVIDCNDVSGKGNGFLFDEYNSEGFANAIGRAINAYYEKDIMDKLIKNAFASEFSWDKSAKEYESLYKCLL